WSSFLLFILFSANVEAMLTAMVCSPHSVLKHQFNFEFCHNHRILCIKTSINLAIEAIKERGNVNGFLKFANRILEGYSPVFRRSLSLYVSGRVYRPNNLAGSD